MSDKAKTKNQLIEELQRLRLQIAETQKSENEYKKSEVEPEQDIHDISRAQHRRSTIGLLLPGIEYANEERVWLGARDAARASDVNLITIIGGHLKAPDGFQVQANVLYDLIQPKRLDGLMIISSAIGWYLDPEGLAAFFERYHPLPRVSLDGVIAGTPSIIKDEYTGLRDAMNHLITGHGYRRIAFLRGPESHEGIQERYRAYCDTLSEFDLPVDPTLISDPQQGWDAEAAVSLMEGFVDERQLRPGQDFEAIVAATDNLARSAIKVLQARGLHVPQDVAVTGFDDEQESRVITPPLTTVPFPAYEMGQRGVETLLALWQGEPVPAEIVIPAKLMVRQSCGCQSSVMLHADVETENRAEELSVPPESGEAALTALRDTITTEVVDMIGVSAQDHGREQVERLVEAFTAEMQHASPGNFLTVLEDILQQISADEADVAIWQNAISILRRRMLPVLSNDVLLAHAENLWDKARVLIGEVAQRAQAYQTVLAEQRAQVLRELGMALITTFEVQSLMDVLAAGLPRLAMPGCYLAGYDNPAVPTEGARLILAYDRQGRREVGDPGVRFPSSDLIPDAFFPQEQRFSLVLMALYFREQQIGFVLFESGPREGKVYETLRGQISSAVQGALLVQRVQENVAEITRQKNILDSFMENVPDTIYFKDLDSRIFQINQAFVDRFELNDAAEVVGKTDFDFFSPEEARPKYEQEQEIIRTGQPLIDLEEPDAGGRWALTTKMPLRNEHNEIIGIFGISRDITEMKQAQKEIEQANQALEVQVWKTTGQSELNDKMRGEQDIETLANNIIRQLCHYLQAQIGALYLAEDNLLTLVGRYAYSSKNSAGRFKFGEGLVGQAALEKEPAIITNIPDNYITIRSGLGETVPRHIMVFPFMYEGQVAGVVEMATLAEFDQTQLDFLHMAMINIGIAFNTAQARARINELLAETQQQAEELQAQGEELRVANEELAAQTESLRTSETKLKEKQTELEATNTQLEEKAAALEENSAILQEKQNILDQQNRELMVAQQELERKAKELALASKYKSEFLANMSHELRTPLNSLLILARMLADNKGGNLTEEQVESSQIIYSGGTDLLNLINDILDLSKVEAGQMVFNFEAMPLVDLVSSMRIQFDHVAQEKGVDFIVNLTEDLPDHIKTDQQRVKQIVKNLLSNAFKFTKEGNVSLNIYRPGSKVDLSRCGLDPSQAIAISVADTGIGMTPEQQKFVFEAFQQADGSTSRQYGGTGLGLSISREMSAKLGGQIEVTSEPGQGSTFSLYLPIEMGTTVKTETAQEAQPIVQIKKTPPPNPAASQPPTQPAHPPVPMPAAPVDDRTELSSKAERGEAVKVLAIIEDDPKFAKVVYNDAHKKGFKCLIANEGKTGLELVERYQPEAIILDLNLPDMSGWEVLTTLKNNPETRHIPVHIMSVDDEALDAYRRGAMGYLTKPVRQENLDKAFDKIEGLILRDIKTLLLVEDDANSRHSIKKLLEGSDVHISEVDQGQAALELLETQPFDCMILDLSLPDMSGFEVLNKMHDNGTITRCPVIIYTGRELTPEENEQLMQYADSVIVKGVKSPERLLDETALFLHRVVADMPREKQQTIKQLYTQDASLEGKKILIVDDDMRNSFALSKLLADKGVMPKIAQNGQRALEMLAENPDFDLILMDIMMPVMDGYETTKRIRAQRKFNGLPILALTAKAMKGDREKCLEAGANDYLSKPVDVDRLFSMLRVWLYQ